MFDKDRNYGIDFLRLLSMFMIVVLHIIDYGGCISSASGNMINYWIANTLLVVVYPCVNCFALISGYVGISAQHHIKRFIKLHTGVLFYSFLFMIIGFFIYDDISLINLMKSLFPAMTRQYWYYSAYVLLFVFMPMLNHFVISVPRKVVRSFIIAVLFLVTISQTFMRVDAFNASSGYSGLWLIIMYVIGAYIRKYEVFNNISPIKVAVVLFTSMAVTLGVKLLIEFLDSVVLHKGIGGGLLILYVSPTIVVSGVCLLHLCSCMKTSLLTSKAIAFLSPLSFGVYLIHTHPVVFNHLIAGKFEWIGGGEWLQMIGHILVVSILIFGVCLIIEKLRMMIWRLVKLDRAVDKIYNFVTGKINKDVLS